MARDGFTSGFGVGGPSPTEFRADARREARGGVPGTVRPLSSFRFARRAGMQASALAGPVESTEDTGLVLRYRWDWLAGRAPVSPHRAGLATGFVSKGVAHLGW